MEKYNPNNIYDAYLYIYKSHNATIEEYEKYIKLLDFHYKTSDAQIYNMTQKFDIALEIRIKIAAENETVTERIIKRINNINKHREFDSINSREYNHVISDCLPGSRS